VTAIPIFDIIFIRRNIKLIFSCKRFALSCLFTGTREVMTSHSWMILICARVASPTIKVGDAPYSLHYCKPLKQTWFLSSN